MNAKRHEGNRQYLAQADLGRAIARVPGSAAAALPHPLLDRQFMPAGLKASLPASFAMLTDQGVRHAYNEGSLPRSCANSSHFSTTLTGAPFPISNVRPVTEAPRNDLSSRSEAPLTSWFQWLPTRARRLILMSHYTSAVLRVVDEINLLALAKQHVRIRCWPDLGRVVLTVDVEV